MSTTAAETQTPRPTSGRTFSTRQVPRRVSTIGPMPVTHIVADDRGSRLTGLVFQVILFCATCLSLFAVIQQAGHDPQASPNLPGTGVYDAPPAVFVSAD